ncbi:sialin-like [Lutzomyia longipalpis]|uniref:sialin-like n=1 Tax=Lutzomyia longipalpis TaxID=7200 RepID=UPI0024836310|nr:sialin-like [Lutzomyia longipalpis]
MGPQSNDNSLPLSTNFAEDSSMAAKNNPVSDTIKEDPVTWMFWKKRRYIVVLMAFLGFFNVYSLRVNLSVAIVAMTEKRNVTYENGTTVEEQYFDWNTTEQGLVLSSFFYGYILTQLIGGYLGSKFGGHYVFASGIGVTAILTLVTPVAAKHSLGMLLAVRIIEGVFEGVTFPCIHAVWARWAPVYERSRMATLGFAGNYAGTVVAMPLSGVLAVSLGWESVFYFFGSLGVVWAVAWLIIVKAGPEDDPFISEEEKTYILKSIGQNEDEKKSIKHPWKAILTSTAVWAIIASHFAENWGFFTLLTQLPTFLKDTLNFELEKTGFISAIPYLAMGCLLGVSGYLADWSQIKGYLTTTQVRKYFNCGAFLAQTVFMMLAAYLLDPVGTVACITVAVGFGAFAWSGFIVNPLDIAPNHASVILGISNTFATIPGIVSPLLTGVITSDKTKEQWQVVFYISSGIYLVGCVIYWFFCRGELQPWAKTNTINDVVESPRSYPEKQVIVNEQFDMTSEQKKN